MRSWGHGSAWAAAWRAGRGCGSIAGHARRRRPVEPAPRLVASDHRGVHARRAALHPHSPLFAGYPLRLDRRLYGLGIQRHLHQPLAVPGLARVYFHQYGKPQVPTVLGILQRNRMEYLRNQSVAASLGEVDISFLHDRIICSIASLLHKAGREGLENLARSSGISNLPPAVFPQLSCLSPVSAGSLHGLFSWHMYLGRCVDTDGCPKRMLDPFSELEVWLVRSGIYWRPFIQGSQYWRRALVIDRVRRLGKYGNW